MVKSDKGKSVICNDAPGPSNVVNCLPVEVDSEHNVITVGTADISLPSDLEVNQMK